MFSSSTQVKHWTFPSEAELHRLREEANEAYIKQASNGDEEQDEDDNKYLNAVEERLLCRHYEYALKEFCVRFKPPMPRNVVGTAMAYLRRFYLHNSVMDYHPREIMLTCVYLACKVEEFNVSIMQFVANIKGDPEKLADIILSFELLLMQQLNYHLTVHNPFRPLEGLLIDIKTKCEWLENAEILRKGAEDLLDKALTTDASLIFAPSQLALAAVLSSATRQHISLDSYVTDSLLGKDNQSQVAQTVETVKRIKYLVKNIPTLNKDEVKMAEKKLSKCRNQANNPYSEVYKQKMYEMLQEEEDYQSAKARAGSEKQRKETADLLGL